ncbi:hypothetical protein PF010_g27758, partial [Phytophthora fragariae]
MTIVSSGAASAASSVSLYTRKSPRRRSCACCAAKGPQTSICTTLRLVKRKRTKLQDADSLCTLHHRPAGLKLARRSALYYAVQQQQHRSNVVVSKSSVLALSRNKHQTIIKEEFPLELGGSLPEVTIEWEQWGDSSLPGDRTILLLPSFSSSSHATSNRDDPRPGWWEKMIGPGKAINSSYFRVICPSVLGSPFGATSPLSMNPHTGEKYKASFPQITPADMARCHAKVLDDLGIDSAHAVIGSSMGGIQALEFAAQFPSRLDRLIGLACTHQTTPGSVAFRRVQRRAILADP